MQKIDAGVFKVDGRLEEYDGDDDREHEGAHVRRKRNRGQVRGTHARKNGAHHWKTHGRTFW